MEINRDTIQDLNRELVNVVRVWAQSKGLTVAKNSGSFDATEGEFTARITLRANTVAGKDREQAVFEHWAPYFGLEPRHYKARFTSRGTEYQIVGFKPRTRLPVIAKRTTDGKGFLFERAVLDQFRPASPSHILKSLGSPEGK